MTRSIQNWGNWYDGVLNSWPFCLNRESIGTFGIAWLFKENGRWVFLPRITGDHQYYNAQLFIRYATPSLFVTIVTLYLMYWWVFVPVGLAWYWSVLVKALAMPFAFSGFFVGVRLTATRLWQFSGIGWKNNGRIALLFRFQTDASAAAGVHSPNPGQATGWDYGEH
jgi:hypothetical protein